MHQNKIQKLLEVYRALKEDGAMGGGAVGAPTNNASDGAIAGLPPDDPPVYNKKKKKNVLVDLRRRAPRKLNMFYREAIKSQRRKNGRDKRS
jgi:hypothetical protein